MSNVYPHTVRVQLFLMAVDPQHRYSNESERAIEDIYDNLKLKNPFELHCLYKLINCFKG